jgi:RNA polymerase sigma-70 factor (ECF subfamily)
MGTQQTYLSNVLPPVGAPQFFVEELEGKPSRSSSRVSERPVSEATVPERPHCEEWAVVQQAIAGNADAQQHLFARHTDRLHRVAFALLRNKEDAEDAVQDGLYRAYTYLRSFRGKSSFSTWLTRIVINSALMSLRRKSVRPEAPLDMILGGQPESAPEAVPDSRPDPESLYTAIEVKAIVEKHVRRLPPTLAAAFRLGAIDGLSAAEASRALGVSVGTFKSRIFRARRKLATMLQPSRLRFADQRV